MVRARLRWVIPAVVVAALLGGVVAMPAAASTPLSFQPVAPVAATDDTFVEGTGGDDANDCLSVATACKTIQSAVDRTAPGGTIHVGEGKYGEHVQLDAGRSLTSISGASDTVINAVSSNFGRGGAGRIENVTLIGDTSPFALVNAPISINAIGDTPSKVHGVIFDARPYTGALGGVAPPADVVIDATGGAGPIDISGNTFIDDAGRAGDVKNGKAGVSMSHSDGPVYVTGNQFRGYRSAVEVTGRARSSDGPGTIIRGNDIDGTYNYSFPSQMGHAISISTENAGAGFILSSVRIVGNVIGEPADPTDTYGVFVSAGITTPPVLVETDGNKFRGNYGGIFWQGAGSSSLALHNDVFTGGTFGLKVSRGTSAQLKNVTFRDNRFDLSTAGPISLDSTLVEDPIDAQGTSASCAISFSRGPVMDPDAPGGCSDFQTTAGPGFASADRSDYHLAVTSPLLDLGNPQVPFPGETDIDGDPRGLGPECSTGPRDIGADEVDGCPPETRIDDPKPTDPSASSVTFHYSSPDADAAGYVCTLDRAPVSCPGKDQRGGSLPLTDLDAGSHIFTVAAFDADTPSNTDASPASFTWTVDHQFDPGVAPHTRIDDPKPTDPSSSSVTFSYSSPDHDAAGYACTLDGAAVDCVGNDPGPWSKQLTDLGAGSHIFTVAAFDADTPRNTDPDPASFTWTVSPSAPDTTIDSGPAAGGRSGRSVVFGYSSPDASAVGYTCTLDGVPVPEVDCPGTSRAGGSAALTSLAAGSHTFTVAAVDVAGLADASPASRTWTVDRDGSHIEVHRLASPHLRITKTRLAVRKLRIAGTTAAAVTGSVTVRYAAKVAGKRLVVKKTVALRAGKFRATLRLKRAMRKAKNGIVRVAYPGDSTFRAQTVKRKVRRVSGRSQLGIVARGHTAVSLNVAGGTSAGGAQPPGGSTLTDASTPAIGVGFGKSLQLAGSLTNATGQPVANTELTVSRELRGGFPSEDLSSVTTDVDGKFSYTLPAGPSALVRFQFAGSDVLAPSEADVQTLVKAAVSLRAKRTHKRNRLRAIFRLSGALAGKPLPTGGKSVAIQMRKGSRWSTIKQIRTSPSGQYASTLKIRLHRLPKHLKLRTVASREETYSYEKGTSKIMTLRIPSKR